MSVSPSPSSIENELWEISELFQRYQKDSLLQIALTQVGELGKAQSAFIKGMEGSLDAVFSACVASDKAGTHVFILRDREEAAYFQNDLQSLLMGREVLLFPTSYKKPYQFQEVENANILQRAEVLNQVNEKRTEGELIVTYPEALTEKVINERSLTENTFSVKQREEVDVATLSEILTEYDFERTDFVYEAGQFAVRGGIVDIFSYAHELPYRLEFFGDEVESIRTFDPDTQLSVDQKNHISIIPNVQTKLLQEVRDSFLNFIPRKSKLWFKDLKLTKETLDAYFKQATADFEEILRLSGQTQVVHSPEDLFENAESFERVLQEFPLIEFGKRSYLKPAETIVFEAKSQPSFNKDFNLFAETLRQNQLNGLTNVITAESRRQLERLKSIFEQIDVALEFKELKIGLRGGFLDAQRNIALYTDHQIFERFHRYYQKKKYSKSKAVTLKELQKLNIGDYVVHADYGVGRFGGMEKVDVNGRKQEAIRLIYRDDDLLYISIHALHKISKYSGKDGEVPPISKLGTQEWENKKKKVKKRVKDIAKELIALYAKRKSSHGFAFSKDTYLQAELESSFIYEDTPDQAKSTQDVKEDMEQPHPMDRLVCGDVGFGKTEVAIRAAFKAVTDSKQVAILVPTTILAIQHFKTFSNRLTQFPCRVEYVNRFRTAAEIRKVLKDVEAGLVDILIGTHRVTSKDVKFKNLGLLVVDEEQKFGVKTKDKLKEMRVNVDVLTLTATPIPRTLHFSLLGARDLSVISTPPPNRQPVTTELHVFNHEVVRDAVSFELRRGGQVFFVHNRISDIESLANLILKLVPDARVAYAHGQMDGKQLEKIMVKFIEGEYDVLVSTNIIESGLDIPNANTIMINQAHHFGLSDLHQMRGRVGRSNRKAYCFLLTPNLINLTAEARKRLGTLEEFSDLGDGFKVAMRDLDIRGAGNLLGAEQSGFINDLGFDMYNKVLEDAVSELKEEEFKSLFQKETLDAEPLLKGDCTIETDFEIVIPENYVSNISERLNLYIAADELKDEQELQDFKKSLTDRFGAMPPSVNDLLKTVRLRWQAQKLGFEKVILKGGKLKGNLLDPKNEAYYQSPIFGKILTYVKDNPKNCRLKEAKNKLSLTIDTINSIDEALNCLQKIHG